LTIIADCISRPCTPMEKMPIEIKPRHRVVHDVGVEIEALRIVQLGVRDWFNLRAPVGRHEPAQGVAAAIIPCAEVIEAGFGIVLFAGKLNSDST